MSLKLLQTLRPCPTAGIPKRSGPRLRESGLRGLGGAGRRRDGPGLRAQIRAAAVMRLRGAAVSCPGAAYITAGSAERRGDGEQARRPPGAARRPSPFIRGESASPARVVPFPAQRRDPEPSGPACWALLHAACVCSCVPDPFLSPGPGEGTGASAPGPWGRVTECRGFPPPLGGYPKALCPVRVQRPHQTLACPARCPPSPSRHSPTGKTGRCPFLLSRCPRKAVGRCPG